MIKISENQEITISGAMTSRWINATIAASKMFVTNDDLLAVNRCCNLADSKAFL